MHLKKVLEWVQGPGLAAISEGKATGGVQWSTSNIWRTSNAQLQKTQQETMKILYCS